MNQREEQFVGLSRLLAGFDSVRLLGTGVADQYLKTLAAALPDGIEDDLFAAYDALPEGDGREAAVKATILDDPKLGPVAENIILLWYQATWNQLPADWHEAYGTSPTEKTGQVSAEAYQAGLMWLVSGAHAPGSSPQGFSAWAFAAGRISR